MLPALRTSCGYEIIMGGAVWRQATNTSAAQDEVEAGIKVFPATYSLQTTPEAENITAKSSAIGLSHIWHTGEGLGDSH